MMRVLWLFIAGMATAFAVDVALYPVAERIYWRRFARWSHGRLYDGAHGCLIPEPPKER